mmetsp:Transcript_38041/g.112980  ORF Transcript_38041/g.112980 Transcript_38041/m.112980 type:complete len:216 (-) Transcript_38041:1125-1772(-)
MAKLICEATTRADHTAGQLLPGHHEGVPHSTPGSQNGPAPLPAVLRQALRLGLGQGHRLLEADHVPPAPPREGVYSQWSLVHSEVREAALGEQVREGGAGLCGEGQGRRGLRARLGTAAWVDPDEGHGALRNTGQAACLLVQRQPSGRGGLHRALEVAHVKGPVLAPSAAVRDRACEIHGHGGALHGPREEGRERLREVLDGREGVGEALPNGIP